MTDKRKVYILLTRFPGTSARAISAFTRCYYTHASIGLDEDPDSFYSFVFKKGFLVEKLTRYAKPGRPILPCRLYELEVSERVYHSIKSTLERFVRTRQTLRYTSLGVVLSILRIPYQRRNHYFCSQFVATVLRCAQAAPLKKSSALYHPRDFQQLPGARLCYQGVLQDLVLTFCLPASACT